MRFKSLLLGIVLVGNQAQAEVGSISPGLGLGFWDYEENGSSEFSPISLEASLEYGVVKGFDVDVKAAFGASSEKEVFPGGGSIEFEISNYVAVYAKPYVQLDTIKLYPLIGYSITRLEATVFGNTIKDSSDGLSYGFGGTMAINESLSATLEWRQQVDNSSYEMSGFFVGCNFKI